MDHDKIIPNTEKTNADIIAELEDDIKTNLNAIERVQKNIVNACIKLSTITSEQPWFHPDVTTWTEGFVAKDVAHMGALLIRQQTLVVQLATLKREI